MLFKMCVTCTWKNGERSSLLLVYKSYNNYSVITHYLNGRWLEQHDVSREVGVSLTDGHIAGAKNIGAKVNVQVTFKNACGPTELEHDVKKLFDTKNIDSLSIISIRDT